MVVLQQSLALASVLSLGHLGTTELGGILHSLCLLQFSVRPGNHDSLYNRYSNFPRNNHVPLFLISSVPLLHSPNFHIIASHLTLSVPWTRSAPNHGAPATHN